MVLHEQMGGMVMLQVPTFFPTIIRVFVTIFDEGVFESPLLSDFFFLSRGIGVNLPPG
jgi:hypothetical protein